MTDLTKLSLDELLSICASECPTFHGIRTPEMEAFQEICSRAGRYDEQQKRIEAKG